MCCYHASHGADGFQFSMRRMILGFVTLFCIACGLASLAFTGQFRDSTALATLIIAGAVAGAGIGLPLGKPGIGAIVGGVLVAIPLGILFYMVGGVCP